MYSTQVIINSTGTEATLCGRQLVNM